MIGAVVGVQPFGGRGLSGTGPKAGGPLILGRLVARPPVSPLRTSHLATPIHALADWLDATGDRAGAEQARRYAAASALGAEQVLPGPVGERNVYSLHPRGEVLLYPASPAGLIEQMAAVLATGNRGVVRGAALPPGLPPMVAAQFAIAGEGPFAACLVEGDADRVRAITREVAALPGPVVPVHAADPARGLAYACDWLLEEVTLSVNTTAAGGNASLMMIG